MSEDTKVSADPNHLNVILRNLIANAFKFTKATGKITISASNPLANFVTISVKDTGIGMTDAQKKDCSKPIRFTPPEALTMKKAQAWACFFAKIL